MENCKIYKKKMLKRENTIIMKKFDLNIVFISLNKKTL